MKVLMPISSASLCGKNINIVAQQDYFFLLFTVGMLGVKRILYHIHNKEIDIQRGALSRYGLCPMHDSPRDSPRRTFYSYPTGFKQLCRGLVRPRLSA